MIVITSNDFLGKLYKFLENQKNQGIYIIKFFNSAGSMYFTLPADQRKRTNEHLENERHYAKDRCLNDEIKASFPNPINLDGLMKYISDNLDSNKLTSCMAEFGIPAGTETDKDKFAKALAMQFGSFVISTEADIVNDVWQIYRSLLNGDKVSPKDIRGPRYVGDDVAVYSNIRIESNCYEHLHHEWDIQNRGKQEWYGRKLVLLNQDEIKPKILQSIIQIPDTKPNKTIKITTNINSGGVEGDFECKWEMQDADGENCFPNREWLFNIKIHVTFTG